MIKKKTQLFLSLLLLMRFTGFAQDCTDYRNLNESVIASAPVSYARDGKVYNDPVYVNDALDHGTCDPGDVCNTNGNLSLSYTVYYPALARTKRLPTIILFHGGGFSDYSDDGGISSYCTEFAKRQFVAISVEYRRGRIKDPKSKYTSASNELAIYRAIQDGRGAIRTIIADEKTNPIHPDYNIDFNNIFVGGASAGDFIAQGIVLLDQPMADLTFPGVRSILGSLDTNMYKGNNKSYTIRAMMNMWGGISIPVNTTAAAFFQSKAKPFIAFHGRNDGVVNIESSDIFFSKDELAGNCNYSKDNICGTYSFPVYTRAADLTTIGSQFLYNAWKTLSVPCELYIDCEMAHGLNDTTNFGTDLSLHPDVKVYMVQRATTFFQSVMNGLAGSYGQSEFIENENLRYGCGAENHGSNLPCYIPPSFTSARMPTNEFIIKEPPFYTLSISKRNILVVLNQNTPSTVYLYNTNGNILKKEGSTGSEHIKINGSTLPAGIYILRIIQGTKNTTQKILLE